MRRSGPKAWLMGYSNLNYSPAYYIVELHFCACVQQIGFLVRIKLWHMDSHGEQAVVKKKQPSATFI